MDAVLIVQVLSQQEAAMTAATQLERARATALALEEEVAELMAEKLQLDYNNNSSDIRLDCHNINDHDPDLRHNNNRETSKGNTSFGSTVDPAAKSGCVFFCGS